MVCCGDEPFAIPVPVIEELRARGVKTRNGVLVRLDDRHLPGYREPLKPGETVRIAVGHHAGLQGTVTLDSGTAVGVEVKILGRTVEVSVAPWALDQAPPDRGDR